MKKLSRANSDRPAPHNKNEGRVETVEKCIRHHIRVRGLRNGDALPKEKEFAQMFGVTRNVVREALSRLRMLGIVESKKRRGMILTSPDIFAGLERIADSGMLDEKAEKDLFEFRLVLELGMADLIFSRKTTDDIRALRSIVAKERNMGADLAREDKLDTDFHRRLFQITGNQPIRRLHNIISSFFSILHKRGRQLLRDKTAPSHKDLLGALEHGPAKRFRELMRRHLEFYFKITKIIIAGETAREHGGEKICI